jgi:hypothetical protein
VLKLFDKSVWMWRRLEWLVPWPGLSLILVARKGRPQPSMTAAGRVQIPNHESEVRR